MTSHAQPSSYETDKPVVGTPRARFLQIVVVHRVFVALPFRKRYLPIICEVLTSAAHIVSGLIQIGDKKARYVRTTI